MFKCSIALLATAAILAVSPVLSAPAAPAKAKTPAKAAPAAKPASPLTLQTLPANLAAVVNGHKITMAQVTAITLQQDAANVVEWQIQVYLIDQEARKFNLKIPSTDIDASVATLAGMQRSANGQPISMAEALKHHHETMSQLREELREGLIKQKVAQYDFPIGRLTHLSEIAIKVSGQPGGHTDADAQALIKTIQDQLKAGKSFTDLAKQYTEDPATKDAGGDVGLVYVVPRGTKPVAGDVGLAYDGTLLDPALVKAASGLKTGDITANAIRTKFGYVLLSAISTGADHPETENSTYAERNLESMLVAGLLAASTIVNRYAM